MKPRYQVIKSNDRYFVRNPDGLYYQSAGQWVSDTTVAYGFRIRESASLVVLRLNATRTGQRRKQRIKTAPRGFWEVVPAPGKESTHVTLKQEFGKYYGYNWSLSNDGASKARRCAEKLNEQLNGG